MSDILNSWDSIGALLFGGAFAMIAFTHIEMRAARICIGLGVIIVLARWNIWAFTVEPNWMVRAVVGASFGALMLGGAPALWNWSYHRALTLEQSIKPKPASEKMARVARLAYSSTQSIKTLPPSMGGINIIKLDAVGTLERSGRYSATSVTMVLDAAPTYYPDVSGSGGQAEGIQVTQGEKKTYLFNTNQNQRHSITIGERSFLVTLLSTRVLDVAGVATPFEYNFSVSEE